jgi:hypothetical protein
MGLEMLAVAAFAASTAAQGIGTVMQMQALNAQADMTENVGRYRAQVARNQAALAEHNKAQAAVDERIARENAGRTAEEYQRMARDQGTQLRLERGALRAAHSASGLAGGSQDAAVDTIERLGAIDRLRTVRQGQTAVQEGLQVARGFRQEGVDYGNAAASARNQADAGITMAGYESSALRRRATAAGVAGAGRMAGTVVNATGNPLARSWAQMRGRS